MRKIILNLQSSYNNLNTIPNKSMFMRWIRYIFSSVYKCNNKKIELTIRIVNEIESRTLNMYFLKNNFPTDVLSFPFHPPAWIKTALIGDLVICYKIVEYEAKMNNIPIENQLAYVVIHGTLHLLGYDHTTNGEIVIMKNIENVIMNKLGYEY